MTRFGIDVSAEEIVDNLSFFDSWEDRYRYIIDLGRELPVMDAALQTDEHLVRGCQSLVWLVHEVDESGHLEFQADSNSHIVKGLLAVVLAAYNGKTAAEIIAVDIEDYFNRLNLIKHLSPSRGNGLRAMVKRIQDTAAQLRA